MLGLPMVALDSKILDHLKSKLALYYVFSKQLLKQYSESLSLF